MCRISSSLVFILTASLIVSCGHSSADQNSDITSGSVTSDSLQITEKNDPEISYTDQIKERFADINYDGYVFRIASPDPGKHFYYIAGPDENEIFYEAETGDTLQDAVFRRNKQAEDILNIQIEPVWCGETPNVKSTVKKQILADVNFADAVLNRLDYSMDLSAEHLLYNFYDIESVDLSSDWWNKSIVENFTIFGSQLYTLSGDINYYDDYAVQAILANKTLLQNLGYDLPYQAVRDGTWTFALFSEIAKAGTSDLNGDGVFTLEDDQIGFANHEHAILHFLYPFGERMSITGDDGTPMINYGSEHLTNVVDTIYQFISDDRILAPSANYGDTFKNGRLVFWAEMIGSLSGLRTTDTDFCVLPLFKEDETQDGYHAYVSNGWTTCYSVPQSCVNPERSGVVLETMSAVSADLVTPALYDIMFTEKYVRDKESQEMLSYVWDSKTYDLAGDLAWASSLRSIYSRLASDRTNTFVSSMEKSMPSMQKNLDKFIAAYQDE